jgi:drug/metabolite transporter (DMT)-like permease
MRSFAGAFLIAAMAAAGNALFVFGQKRSTATDHPFLFPLFATLVCAGALALGSLILPPKGAGPLIRENLLWFALAGLGLFLTFVGFYYLFTRFGASYYALYAVLAILTTSIAVGVLVFHEPFNVYHWISIGCAIAAIVFFGLGRRE